MKISLNRVLVFLLFFMVVTLFIVTLYTTGLLIKWYPYALPYQQCGGSRLDDKSCISGFVCKPLTVPNVPGAGGTCQPINK